MYKLSVPIWPLPCDWRWAGTATNQPYASEAGTVQQCPKCTQWLTIRPGDDGAMRRHKRGVKCRKGREVVEMNNQGFHVMTIDGHGFWSEALRPVMREGTFYKFYPAPIVSFIRWKLPTNGRSNVGVTKEFNKELADFMKLTEEQQVSFLSGVILEVEYRR